MINAWQTHASILRGVRVNLSCKYLYVLSIFAHLFPMWSATLSKHLTASRAWNILNGTFHKNWSSQQNMLLRCHIPRIKNYVSSLMTTGSVSPPIGSPHGVGKKTFLPITRTSRKFYHGNADRQFLLDVIANCKRLFWFYFKENILANYENKQKVLSWQCRPTISTWRYCKLQTLVLILLLFVAHYLLLIMVAITAFSIARMRQDV
jgi:hypothetical protein